MPREKTIRTPSQKVIIIGATSGIGRELALLYAKQKAMVCVSGRRTELLLSLQKKYPNNILIETFDVTGKENIPHVQNMISQLDGLDLLIYNSGYGEMNDDLDWDIEKQTTEVNVNGFVEVVCYAFNYLKNQGHGQIACTSSVASIRGNSHNPAYNASKAFQSNFMEGLYMKTKRMKVDISITDLQPGFVRTDMMKGTGAFWVAEPRAAAEQMAEAIRLKKRRAYITRRWWIIATLMKRMPVFLYRRITR